MSNTKKAILLVSFGTSYHKTKEKTIDMIEKEFVSAFPDHQIYCAWTSKTILAKIMKRDGVKINNVKEAMAQMQTDGITDIIVQPTYVINGHENHLLKEDALSFRNQFHSITFSTPLLTGEQDTMKIIEAIHEEFPNLSENEALVLMGHGTGYDENSFYTKLDDAFKENGYLNIFLKTFEKESSIEKFLELLKEKGVKKVILAPFLIVAGKHAMTDMAGDEPFSWKRQFEEYGFEVSCYFKGLGEYPAIREVFVRHVTETFEGI